MSVTGKTLYRNRDTGETSWSRPLDPRPEWRVEVEYLDFRSGAEASAPKVPNCVIRKGDIVRQAGPPVFLNNSFIEVHVVKRLRVVVNLEEHYTFTTKHTQVTAWVTTETDEAKFLSDLGNGEWRVELNDVRPQLEKETDSPTLDILLQRGQVVLQDSDVVELDTSREVEGEINCLPISVTLSRLRESHVQGFVTLEEGSPGGAQPYPPLVF